MPDAAADDARRLGDSITTYLPTYRGLALGCRPEHRVPFLTFNTAAWIIQAYSGGATPSNAPRMKKLSES